MNQLGSGYRECEKFPERVLQFGEGNFLRAFVDWMIHRMNKEGLFQGSVAVVQPLPQGMIDVVNQQDGLYSLFLRGIKSGEVVNEKEVIESLSRGIDPYENWTEFLNTARNPEMRFVVSNTTEAGIGYTKTEFDKTACPASFPAKVTLWLLERFSTFHGTSESGVIFLPCELINHNGKKLRECVLKYTEAWQLDDQFVRWIKEDCVFLSTLVDRIVPGYPRDEIDELTNQLGFQDKLICTGEHFHLFVIEGPKEIRKELPFDQVGLNVVWCDDLQPYRNRKVGVLNGAHTSSVLAAFLGGLNTVSEMMEDDDFSRFVKQIVFSEIVPSLNMDQDDAKKYAEAVMERFMNPFIQHELLSISLNSVAKWKVRVLPSLEAYVKKTGEIPALLSFSLAALIAFYKGDLRAGYELRDDSDVCSFFRETWNNPNCELVVPKVLGASFLWGEDLNQIPGLSSAVSEHLKCILEFGMRDAVQKLLG